MSKLSIVVPIYNSANYLQKCIDSIISQSYCDIQIVLVDDGSTDDSGIICDSYCKKDERILVIHQTNQGPLRARYNGVLKSEGEYVTFVDADDWLDLDAYSNFEELLNRGVDLVVFGKVVETENSGSTFPEIIYEEGYYDKEMISELIHSNMIWDVARKRPGIAQSLNDKIFKRQYLLKSYEQTKDFPKVHNGEDPMILYPLMQWIESLYISKECPYHYRQHIKDVPSYISNDDYFEKLFLWYKYLLEHTSQIRNAKKQIEYVYLYLLERRKEYYGDFVHNDDYFFPFNKVPSKSKIILYGAGRQGATYYEQIKRIDYCDIVLWVDKNYKLYQDRGVQDISKVKEIDEFDYIVIAIFSMPIKNEITKWLIDEGIQREKII